MVVNITLWRANFLETRKKKISLFVVNYSIDHVCTSTLQRLVQEGRVALVQHHLGTSVQEQLHGSHVSLPGGDVQRSVLVQIRKHNSTGLDFIDLSIFFFVTFWLWEIFNDTPSSSVLSSSLGLVDSRISMVCVYPAHAAWCRQVQFL